MAHELPALPEAFVYGPPIDVAGAICEQKRPRYFSVNQMRDYATAHAASLEAEVERLRAALRKADDALRIIGEQDPVENMLDPQWAARIAISTRAELP